MIVATCAYPQIGSSTVGESARIVALSKFIQQLSAAMHSLSALAAQIEAFQLCWPDRYSWNDAFAHLVDSHT